MPEVDDEVSKDEEFGALESVKASSDLVCPVSGTVVENNAALEDAPELINQDPYENWIIKVKMSDPYGRCRLQGNDREIVQTEN